MMYVVITCCQPVPICRPCQRLNFSIHTCESTGWQRIPRNIPYVHFPLSAASRQLCAGRGRRPRQCGKDDLRISRYCGYGLYFLAAFRVSDTNLACRIDVLFKQYIGVSNGTALQADTALCSHDQSTASCPSGSGACDEWGSWYTCLRAVGDAGYCVLSDPIPSSDHHCTSFGGAHCWD